MNFFDEIGKFTGSTGEEILKNAGYIAEQASGIVGQVGNEISKNAGFAAEQVASTASYLGETASYTSGEIARNANYAAYQAGSLVGSVFKSAVSLAKDPVVKQSIFHALPVAATTLAGVAIGTISIPTTGVFVASTIIVTAYAVNQASNDQSAISLVKEE
jgi:hypothetical protein